MCAIWNIYIWKEDAYVKLYLSGIWLFVCITVILSYFVIFNKTLKINPFLITLIILIVYCYLALFNSYYNFQISSSFLHKLPSYFS